MIKGILQIWLHKILYSGEIILNYQINAQDNQMCPHKISHIEESNALTVRKRGTDQWEERVQIHRQSNLFRENKWIHRCGWPTASMYMDQTHGRGSRPQQIWHFCLRWVRGPEGSWEEREGGEHLLIGLSSAFKHGKEWRGGVRNNTGYETE